MTQRKVMLVDAGHQTLDELDATDIPALAVPTLAAVLGSGAAANGKITSVTDPTSDQDAATKKYVDDNAGGGGASGGVWKIYGTDSNATPPIAGITVGNGVLEGKWWTEKAVVADPATDPFLCHVYAKFTLGSTSSVDSQPQLLLPYLVDGSGNDLVPADNLANVFAAAVLGSTGYPGAGVLTSGAQIATLAGVAWGTTSPAVWAEGDSMIVQGTFRAKFAGD